MVMNINQTTEQLRMLPDQALQLFAQRNKEDPYLLALAIGESNARKKMRAAMQAQQQQPQPTVRDQAIAAMAPAPAPGIAALQTPNMQNMADGGIAGYDEDGMTGSYENASMSPGMLDFAQHSEPVVRMSGGGVPGYAGRTKSLVSLEDYDLLDQFFSDQELRALSGETYAEMKARQRREKQMAEAAEAEGRPFARGLKAIEAADMSPSPATYALQRGAAALRRTMYPSQEELGILPASAAATAAPTSASAAPSEEAMPRRTSFPSQQLERAVVKRDEGAPPAPPRERSEFKSDSSLYSLDPAVNRKRAQELMPTSAYETAFNVQAQKEREREEARELERERAKPTGKAKEGLEALLKQEGEGAAKEMGDAKAFALIRAGLAIASGSSPNALKNIAEGLNVGVQDYQAAVKDLKKADRERKLMLADIQEARRLEERGDYDKADARRERADDRATSRERFFMSGIMQLGMNRDQIAAGFAKAAQEGAIKRDIAGIEAASRREVSQLPGAQERIITQLGGGDFKKGYDIYRQEGQMPTLFSAYEKLANDTTIDGMTGKTKGAMFRARYPDFQAYRAEFERSQAGGAGGVAPKVSADPLGIR